MIFDRIGDMKKIILVLLLLFSFWNLFTSRVLADDPQTYEAKVIEVTKEEETVVDGKSQFTQELKIEIISGDLLNSKYEVVNGGGDFSNVNVNHYRVNDRVMVMAVKDNNGQTQFFVTDYVRRPALFWLLAIFLIVALLVGRGKSLSSLFGLILTFFVILKFIIPQISAGRDPVLISIIGSLFILPVIFYLTHGINRKTNVALIGTLIAVIFTGLLSIIFINFSRLTGFNTEEASLLSLLKGGTFNIQGLLLAGIIIGAFGVLDDVTISQAAIVYQLQEVAKDKLSFWELFTRAMAVGRDHIASVINTLFLVYAGASLPLLILFTNNPRPLSELINYEPVATEIVRTLVGSMGLILAVPLTPLIACMWGKKSKPV